MIAFCCQTVKLPSDFQATSELVPANSLERRSKISCVRLFAMPSLADPLLQPPLSNPYLPMPYADHVVGAAVFDLNGLPKDYFTTPEGDSMSWVQTIFQALGLRSLLMSSLQLDGFHHATILGSHYAAIVVKQKNHYMALLIQPEAAIDEAFIHWVQTFELSELKNNPRFHTP